MLNTGFPPWPSYADDEIEAVRSVLSSNKVNYWTGDEGRSFEKEFAASCGSDYAIALANGTAALELALRVAGIGSGDEVIVTSRTFIASASCIVLSGAVPVFADVDPVSQNITADTVKRVISKKTKAIIAVHLAGWPCDMDPLLELAREHNLVVIEDCAQANGAKYHGKSVGSLGDIAAWSFCQDKIISTGGEGGMLTLNNREWWDRAWSYKDHGKSFDAVFNRQHPPGFRWLHESFGTNWRLTEMQAAIGRIHLRKLPKWNSSRRRNAASLTQVFREIPGLRVTEPPESIDHAYYKYYVFVEPSRLSSGWDRDRIMNAISAEGVPCYSGSCSEIYLEKAFERAGLQPRTRLEVAKRLGETSLMFLVHPTLDESHMKAVSTAVERVMKIAAK